MALQPLKDLDVKKHLPFTIILAIAFIVGIFTVWTRFALPPISQLKALYFLFGLSVQALLFLWAIGIFLINRWRVTGKRNKSNFYFGISFLIYSWLFIGTLLQSFRDPNDASQLIFSFANLNQPLYFFIFRQAMILWAAGMWYGLSLILTDEKKFQWYSTAAMLIVFYSWFIVGLFVLDDTTRTMYGFLFLCFIPVCLIIAYMFYLYGRQRGLTAPRYLTVGFSWLAITYAFWGPWRDASVVYMYFIMFFLFIISLAIILLGFILIPREQEALKHQQSS